MTSKDSTSISMAASEEQPSRLKVPTVKAKTAAVSQKKSGGTLKVPSSIKSAGILKVPSSTKTTTTTTTKTPSSPASTSPASLKTALPEMENSTTKPSEDGVAKTTMPAEDTGSSSPPPPSPATRTEKEYDDSDKENVDFSQVLERMKTFQASVHDGSETVMLKHCLKTLLKILENILREKKYNPKTRAIKLDNKMFQERIAKVDGGIDFLLACKFSFYPENHGEQPPTIIKLKSKDECRDLLKRGRDAIRDFAAKEKLSLVDAPTSTKMQKRCSISSAHALNSDDVSVVSVAKRSNSNVSDNKHKEESEEPVVALSPVKTSPCVVEDTEEPPMEALPTPKAKGATSSISSVADLKAKVRAKEEEQMEETKEEDRKERDDQAEKPKDSEKDMEAEMGVKSEEEDQDEKEEHLQTKQDEESNRKKGDGKEQEAKPKEQRILLNDEKASTEAVPDVVKTELDHELEQLEQEMEKELQEPDAAVATTGAEVKTTTEPANAAVAEKGSDEGKKESKVESKLSVPPEKSGVAKISLTKEEAKETKPSKATKTETKPSTATKTETKLSTPTKTAPKRSVPKTSSPSVAKTKPKSSDRTSKGEAAGGGSIPTKGKVPVPKKKSESAKPVPTKKNAPAARADEDVDLDQLIEDCVSQYSTRSRQRSTSSSAPRKGTKVTDDDDDENSMLLEELTRGDTDGVEDDGRSRAKESRDAVMKRAQNRKQDKTRRSTSKVPNNAQGRPSTAAARASEKSSSSKKESKGTPAPRQRLSKAAKRSDASVASVGVDVGRELESNTVGEADAAVVAGTNATKGKGGADEEGPGNAFNMKEDQHNVKPATHCDSFIKSLLKSRPNRLLNETAGKDKKRSTHETEDADMQKKYDGTIENIPLPDGLDDNDHVAVHFGIKACFAAFAVVFRRATPKELPGPKGLASLNTSTKLSQNEQRTLPEAPKDVCVLLWKNVLRQLPKDATIAASSDEIGKAMHRAAALAHAKTDKADEDSGTGGKLGDTQLRDVCEYVFTALHGCGLLSTTKATSDKGNGRKEKSTGSVDVAPCRIDDSDKARYGTSLAAQVFAKDHGVLDSIMTAKHTRANWDDNESRHSSDSRSAAAASSQSFDSFLRSVRQRFYDGQSAARLSRGSTDRKLERYAAQWLPQHYYNLGQSSEAHKLLTDEAFVKARFSFLGVGNGAKVFASDWANLVRTKKKGATSNQILERETSEDKGESADEDGEKESKASSNDGCVKEVKESYLLVAKFLRQEKEKLSPAEGEDDNESEASRTERGSALEVAQACQIVGQAVGAFRIDTTEMDHYEDALRLKRLAFTGEDDYDSISETLLCIATCHQKNGDLEASMECFEEIYRLITDRHGNKSTEAADLLQNIGEISSELGNLDRAMRKFEKSAEIRRSVEGDDSARAADTWCWIGKVLREKGEYHRALNMFQKAYMAKEKSQGWDHVETAEVLQYIGILYDDLERYDHSGECYKECYHVRVKNLGEVHALVVEPVVCLANVYRVTHDEENCIRCLRKAVKIRLCTYERGDDDCSLEDVMQHYKELLHVMSKKLISNNGRGSLHREIASMLVKMGSLYEGADKHDKGIDCYKKAMQIYKKKSDYRSVGSLLNAIGIVQGKRHLYNEAIKCMSDALMLRKAVLGRYHVDVGETLHNIGICESQRGEYAKALPSYEEALRIKAKVLGKEHLSTMKTLHNLGIVFEEQGKYNEALACYEEVLKVRVKSLADDHLDIAFSRHSVGKMLRRKGNAKDAEMHLTAALRSKCEQLPQSHLSVAETLYEIAMVKKEKGKIDEASACLRTALTTYEAELGVHLSTSDVLEALGAVYGMKGDPSKSLEYLQKALAIRTQYLSDNDVSIAEVLYLMGKQHEKRGYIDEALRVFQNVLSIREKANGKGTCGVAAVLNDIGVIHLRQGHLDKAGQCFDQALKTWKSLLGDNHEYVGETLINFGDLEMAKGKFDDALPYFQEAKTILEWEHGSDHHTVAHINHKLGKINLEAKDLDQAITLFELCLAVRTQKLGIDAQPVAEVLGDLGEAYLEKGDFDIAREHLCESLRVKEMATRRNNPSIARTMHCLGKVMIKMRYLEEALVYFEDSLKARKERGGEAKLAIADVLFDVATVLEMKEDNAKSLEKMMECCDIRREFLGETHEMVANARFAMGSVSQKLDRKDNAIDYFSSALTSYMAVLGTEHMSVAKTLYSLAVLYDEKEDNRSALKHYMEALRLRRIHMGSDSLKVAVCLDKIARLHTMQRHNDLALKCLREALKIRTAKLRGDHPEIGTNLFGMGIILSDLGQLEKAMDCYQASLDIRRKRKRGHGKEDGSGGKACIEIAQTLHNMGSVHALRREFQDALYCFQSALSQYREAMLPNDNHMLVCARQNVEMAETAIRKQKRQHQQESRKYHEVKLPLDSR